MAPFQVGPFSLVERIGRGGMGEVWRAHHGVQNVDVAIKVLTARHVHAELFKQAFRNEARSVAGLDHPNIVRVFDYGEVTPLEGAQGPHPPGSPWLAMELVDGSSLARVLGRLPWHHSRQIVLALLDGLAHAHARGVVHRDLKPSNVLLGPRGVVKLCDFGLAQALEADEASAPMVAPVVGTPSYMAPEQVEGHWRDVGPWTDLYGLGCLVWALVTGAPPFQGDTPKDTLLSQLIELPDTFQPAAPVPIGLEAWLRILLDKEPEDRFLRAADAAWALIHLERSDAEASGRDPATFRWPAPRDPAARRPEERTLVSSTPGEAERRDEPSTSSLYTLAITPPRPRVGSRRRLDVAQLPASWRRTVRPERTSAVHGVGLGLFGLRAIRLVGREAERDQLWQTLLSVNDEARPRLVLLEGPAGAGKSRLAQWLVERAHELGAASNLRALHGPGSEQRMGLGPMLARHLGCQGLSGQRLATRLSDVLERWRLDDTASPMALARVMSPPSTDQAHQLSFSSPVERYEAISRLIQGLARTRPAIVWLDDALWDAQALGLARHLLARRDVGQHRVLVVITLQEESLAELPAHAELLDEIMGLPGALRMRIGPLPRPDHRALVRGLLGLEDSVAGHVEDRTAGNPLFAVQLVGDWVARGLLEPEGGVFCLRPGADLDLPAGLAEVWFQRIERLLVPRPTGAARALELAAVLGPDVDTNEWSALCEQEGLEVPWDLIEQLLNANLARSAPAGLQAGWSFAHGMVRECVELRARGYDRLSSEHQACARLLAPRAEPLMRDEEPAPGTEPGLLERLGRHLLGAGQLEEALRPLRHAALAHRSNGDLRVGASLLTEYERALGRIGRPAGDPRWGQVWLDRADNELDRGRLDPAGALLDDVDRNLAAGAWERLGPRLLATRGRLARLRGQLADAESLFLRSVSEALRLGQPTALAAGWVWLGETACDVGDLERARRYARRALRAWQGLGRPSGAASVHMLLASIEMRSGALDAAAEQARRAGDNYDRAGLRTHVARSLQVLGEVHRLRGEPDEAARQLEACLEVYQSVGASDAAGVELSLGILDIQTGRFATARNRLLHCRDTTRRDHDRTVALGLDIALAACAAHQGDWDEYDRCLDSALQGWETTRIVSLDAAQVARRAGELAIAAGQDARSQRAFRLARDQWAGLGRVDEAVAITALLEQD